MQFEIKNRWTGKVQFSAEIACADDALPPIKIGLAVKWAIEARADLSDTVLSGADLSGADLSDVPKIENIHQAIYAAASAPDALEMGAWHCGTAHCRAGWAITLAGEAGLDLENRVGAATAGALIYLASDPNLGRMPNFYASNEDALADMKARAEAEAASQAQA